MKLFVKENQIVDTNLPSNKIMNILYDSSDELITTHCYNLFSELVSHSQVLFMHPECPQEELVQSSLYKALLNSPLNRVKEDINKWSDNQFCIITTLIHQFLDFPKVVMIIPDPIIFNTLYRNKLIDDYLTE